MKKITLSLVMITIAISVFTQTPQAFKYQAVVRDNAGEIIANTSVSFRIGVHDGTAGGTIVYQETHTSITTNQFGLAQLEIGYGLPTIGSFPLIDWGSGPKFIEIEVYFHTAYRTSKIRIILSSRIILSIKIFINIIITCPGRS